MASQMVDALFCTISLKDESEKIVKLSSTYVSIFSSTYFRAFMDHIIRCIHVKWL
jgi:hypothetical protein